MLLSNQKFDCKQHGLVIAQLCLGNLVCCLAPFNLCTRDVRQPWILQHTPPGNGSGFDNAHFTWWHENCLWCLSTTVAVVAWMVNFTSAIQKWSFKLFYRSFSTMKLVNSFLLFFYKVCFCKVLCSNLSAGTAKVCPLRFHPHTIQTTWSWVHVVVDNPVLRPIHYAK